MGRAGPVVRLADAFAALEPRLFWRQGGSGWYAPGIGGTLYNEPGLTHAMASDGAPLLAIWCPWMSARMQ